MKGILYVLPNVISGDNLATLSLEALEVIEELSVFAVENPKFARRFIRALGIDTNFDECEFISIHHKTDQIELNQNFDRVLDHLQNGVSVGILSDAGMAGIADPGSQLIGKTHQHQFRVKPITGPSSIFLALAASGFNGQKFTFHGYLPIEERHRKSDLKAMEAEIQRSNTTQIFMETPYRNNKLLQTMRDALKPETLVSIACNISGENEMIVTQPMRIWSKQKHDLNKRPAIFLIGTV